MAARRPEAYARHRNVFLTLMVIGLAGLVVMALPAFGGHGHAHGAHGHGAGHAGALGRGSGGTQGRSEVLAAHPASASLARFIPSPRAICSVLALYGAFGNVLARVAQLPFLVAALGALLPALLVEWALVRPVWNLVFRFQSPPSAPLAALVLAEAVAVIPFRNGRGIVSAVREGRAVQFSARLIDAQATWPVRVGDRLRVEDVDAELERVTVSVVSGPDPDRT